MATEQTFECAEMMDISSVATLYQELNTLLEKGGSVTFKASEIERVDAAVLQLFVCFFREASNRSMQVHWQEPADSLKRAATHLGVDQILQLAS